jgi:hypothetical protein
MGWLSDIGNAVSSAVGAVGDAVEGVVDAVSGAAHDVVDVVVDGAQAGLGWANGWLCRNAGAVGCRIGNIILGGLSGLLEGLQAIAGRLLDIVGKIGGALGALLRGDLAGFLAKLAAIIADVVLLILDVVRFLLLGTIISGVVDAWQAEDLRRFVETLVNERFGNIPPLLARIRARIGLDGVGWGLPFKCTHRVFRLDSGAAPLWRWHKDGAIDLYAMAGLTSFDSFDFLRRRTMIRSVNADGTIESSLPINRWTLAHYIDSEGKDGRIHVYALAPDAVKDFIQVAIAKFKKLGVKLEWNDGGRFDFFASNAVHDIETLEELTFDRAKLGQYLRDQGLRSVPDFDQCNLLALGAFGFVKGLGQTSLGRSIREGGDFDASPCATSGRTPGRTDKCCNLVNPQIAAGLAYHDQWPPQIFRYVLAHECGHYFGLCHYGHDGLQSIMYTPAPEANLSAADWGLFRYYFSAEPNFTLDDGKNVWRFLVSELAVCLDPGPVIL